MMFDVAVIKNKANPNCRSHGRDEGYFRTLASVFACNLKVSCPDCGRRTLSGTHLCREVDHLIFAPGKPRKSCLDLFVPRLMHPYSACGPFDISK